MELSLFFQLLTSAKNEEEKSPQNYTIKLNTVIVLLTDIGPIRNLAEAVDITFFL